MIIEYIRYDLVAHEPEELMSAYGAAADSLRASAAYRTIRNFVRHSSVTWSGTRVSQS
jgi:hypothetical protein